MNKSDNFKSKNKSFEKITAKNLVFLKEEWEKKNMEKLTISKLSKETGISSSILSEYFSGKSSPPLKSKNAEKLSNFFNVNIDEIYKAKTAKEEIEELKLEIEVLKKENKKMQEIYLESILKGIAEIKAKLC